MATINSIGSNIPISVTQGGTGNTSLTDHTILVGAGTAAVTQLGVGTSGHVLIGSSGADPVFAALASSGGTITFSLGAGTLNLEAVVDLTPWNEVTTTPLALLINEGYIMNKADAITATLPATAAVGSIIKIVGKGAGLSIIAQNAGQTIHFGSSATTEGAGGSLTATNLYDCLDLLCITANTTFCILSSVGNWEIV